MQTKRIPRALMEQLLSEQSQERFWSKVKISIPEKSWLWQASANKAGYGQMYFRFGGKVVKIFAHRLAWMYSRQRPLPSGKVVIHDCDNPCCTNPHHIKASSQLKNMQDCLKRERFPIGECHPQSKLSNSEVLKIRALYATATFSQMELANLFGVCQMTVNRIVRRKMWAHI